MKSIFKSGFFLCGALLLAELSFSQVKTSYSFTESKKSVKMDTLEIQIENKEAIRNLYENILNKRKLEQLNILISEEYTNVQGGKGVEGFQKQILELIKAFPDAQWKVEEMIAEGNSVIVKQKIKGTQTGQFQNIAPTKRTITNEGIGIYEFKNGKIIHHQIQTDRLGFLQQLGVLPIDISALTQKKENENTVCFVDKFFVPKTSIDEFKKQMNYNRNFIKTISGFIKSDAIQQLDEQGYLTIMTVVVWENQECLNKAKILVQEEFKKTNFNPTVFYKRLNIKLERGLYTFYREE